MLPTKLPIVYGTILLEEHWGSVVAWKRRHASSLAKSSLRQLFSFVAVNVW